MRFSVRTGLALGLAGAAVLVTAAASPSAASTRATPVWTVTAVPAPAGAGGVPTQPVLSCARGGDGVCAIGSSAGNDGVLTSIDAAGAATSVVAPRPSSLPDSIATPVTQVACGAPDACVAFANDTEGPWDGPSGYGIDWNGASWTSDNGLGYTERLACNVTRCVGAGTIYDQEVAEQGYFWDRPTGGSWHSAGITLPWPPQEYGSDAYVTDVACPPSGACFGLGWADRGSRSAQLPLFYYRSGSTWRGVNEALPPGTANGLSTGAQSGLTCPSATNCLALGSARVRGSTSVLLFAETLTDGVLSPTTIALPAAATGVEADGLSCVSMTSCAGFATWTAADHSRHPVLVRLSGTTWTTRSLPKPAGSIGATANAVACASTSACVVVGERRVSVGGSIRARPASWLWTSGAGWTAQALAAPAGTHDDALDDVACPSTQQCVAIGHADGRAQYANLSGL